MTVENIKEYYNTKPQLPEVGSLIDVEDFTVPEVEIDGIVFEEVEVKNEKLRVVDVDNNRVIVCFDHLLFDSAISKEEVSYFTDSTLYKYLKEYFLPASKINAEIGLLSAFEIFGDSEDFIPEISMFNENPKQFEYFKICRNRIFSDKEEKESFWYWTSSRAKTLAAAYFCFGGNDGNADYSYASGSGGVSPAFKIC